ncbi:MAG: ParB/RepB/Spo0J family partition protein [Chitinophagaceae bacterium]|nr:ParB/RepB/Spo0J family partition protein [Chitinophagaceae bacterium]
MSQINKKQGLGKGIRALLDTIDDEMQAPKEGVPAVSGQNANTIARIPLDQITVNPKQPRKDFEEQPLQELAASIKLHDVIQPVTVVKTGPSSYQLISGERRLRASKIAGLTDIPAYIRTADSQGILEMALLENLQREDLNAIEIALSYRQLMDECGLTQEQVSERMKKERSTVANYLRLLKLPPDIQKAVRDGQISMGHARAIIGLDHVEQQLYVYREITQRGLSVRQVEQMVKELSSNDAAPIAPKGSAAKLPVAYKRIEDNMASHLSTKVKLDRKKSGKGKIVIEFYNDEDLERIMSKMNL